MYPIVEVVPVVEFYADCAPEIEVFGGTIWMTFFRVQRDFGSGQLVRVPTTRVGRSLTTYDPLYFSNTVAMLRKTITLGVN